MPAGACIASVGRPRLLVPVPTRRRLAALTPDFDGPRASCDRLGLLGCYVYSPPTAEGRLAARMFTPSIGVGEDIANANSTAGLSAHFAEDGRTEIAVDMGDALGTPATITATARRAPSATIVRVGGRAAAIARTIRL
jgi:trans-2,3-dihydro-3-hydroxyanthranilate isomerase